MEKIGLEAILKLTDFNKGVKQYESGVDSMVKKTSAFGDSAMQMGTKLTAGITLPLAAIGGVAVKAASDLSESMNKSQVVFGTSADAVEKWSKASAEAFGLSQRGALEAAGTFGNLFTSMGMGQVAAADMSTKLVELAGDLASFNNIDPTLALEKLRSGLVGEVEPLRTLGVNISAAATQTEALRLGLIKAGEEMTAQEAVQARFSLILQQTGNAQGDFARTSDGLANSTRIAKAELENAAAMLGERLIPMAADAVGFVSDLVGKFTALPEPVMKAILAVAGIAAAAGPAATAIGALSAAVSLMLANPIIVGIGLLAAAIGGLVVHFQNVRDKAEETAAEILDTADSYVEYKKRAEDAGVASQTVSEGLYDVYKSAKKAGSEITSLDFQKATNDLKLMMLNFREGNVILGEYGEVLEGTITPFDELLTKVSAATPDMSDLDLAILETAAGAKELGEYIGLTGDELDMFVTHVMKTATAQDRLNARMAETSAAIQEERAQLRAAKGDISDSKAATDGLADSTVRLAGSLTKVGEAAATGSLGLQQSATEMAKAITGASGDINKTLDEMIGKWDELTAAEQRALQIQLAQQLLNLAWQMVTAGDITVAKYAELRGAFVAALGTMVDEGDATTQAILSMFGQWAVGAGVTAEEVAGSVGNISSTIKTANADAVAAETALINMAKGPQADFTNLTSKAITLGSRISEIPPTSEIGFAMTNYDDTLQKVKDISDAINNIPTKISVEVQLNLKGPVEILPKSPHTDLEYALLNIATAAELVRSIPVGLSLPGGMGGGLDSMALAGGGMSTSNVVNNNSYDGDTVNLNIASAEAWKMAERWVEGRRRDRLNVRM